MAFYPCVVSVRKPEMKMMNGGLLNIIFRAVAMLNFAMVFVLIMTKSTTTFKWFLGQFLTSEKRGFTL